MSNTIKNTTNTTNATNTTNNSLEKRLRFIEVLNIGSIGIIGSITLVLVCIGSILWLVFSYPPTYKIHFNTITIPILIPFFLLLFFTIYFFVSLIFKSKLQGFVIGIFCVSYLLLRYFGFTNWFFSFLLIVLFVLIEIILTIRY